MTSRTKGGLSIAFSIADQKFLSTKSVGIFNVSVELMIGLSSHPDVGRLTVLGNSSVPLPGSPSPSLEVIDYSNRTKNPITRASWDQLGVYREAARANAEWLFLPKGFASFVRKPQMSLAAYVHDTLHEHYRQNHPSWGPSLEGTYFRRSLLASLRTAAVIFTNSEFSKSELEQLATRQGVGLPKIIVAGIGFREPVGSVRRGTHVVALLSPYPHKRSTQAVEWLDRWQTKGRFPGDVHLIGKAPPGLGQAMHKNWHLHGRLAEPEYRAIVDSAKVAVCFSEYEGFGMPPVEAVVAGVSPVYSRIPATVEVMGSRGFGFDNEDYDSFSAAMDAGLSAHQSNLSEWASELLSIHDWSLVTDRIVSGLHKTGQLDPAGH